jgi:hypothetical protein
MQNDPNTAEVASRVHLSIRVENLEDKYNYFWTVEKFNNRLALVRDYLEDFFDDGVLQTINEDNDPFWDPPAPKLLGQTQLRLINFARVTAEADTKELTFRTKEGVKLQGHVEVLVTVCDENGDIESAPQVDHPDDLEELQEVSFKVKIHGLELEEHNEYWNNNTYACFQLPWEKHVRKTNEDITGEDVEATIITVDDLSPQIISQLKMGRLDVHVYGHPPHSKVGFNAVHSSSMQTFASSCCTTF